MNRSKIGFHLGPVGILDGLGIFMETLDAAGIPFFLKASDTAGPLFEGQELAIASGIPHVLVYRKSGDGYDVPDYSLSPLEAAIKHWDKHITLWPPELDKDYVWLETVNELNDDVAEWVATFCIHTADLALRDGYKWAGPGWSSGEPPRLAWVTDAALAYLYRVAMHPDRLAIALHEYSYEVDVLKNDETYPWKIGRFQAMFDICDANNIPRPTTMITEGGWTYNDCPDADLAMEQLKEIAPIYAAHDIPFAIWALGPGDKGLNRKINDIMFPMMDYILDTEFDSEPEPGPVPIPVPPVIEPPVVPPDAATIDIAQFVTGIIGIQHVLQCRFGDHFQGTQTLCTLNWQDNIRAQQKDNQVEVIYHDDRYIYRSTDTSPGDHIGKPTYYVQREGGKRGAYWCDRYAKVGRVFNREPYVEHCYFDSCLAYSSDYAESQLRLAAYFDNYIFEDGYVFDCPVIMLTWEINGRVIECYYYGWKRGLVKWEQMELGWKSYLVEEHFDRPPMDPPAWPTCHPRPTPDIMYYREAPPVPPTPISPPIIDPTLKLAIDAAVLVEHRLRGIRLNPNAGLQIAIHAAGLNIPINEIDVDGYPVQSGQNLTTGELRSFVWMDGKAIDTGPVIEPDNSGDE